MPSSIEVKIDNELNWRFDELAILKNEVRKTPNDSTQRTALMRAAWTILYAHYEGFCLFALRQYLTEIELVKVRLGDVNYRLRSHALAPIIKSLRNASDKDVYDFMTIALRQVEGAAIKFDRNKKSNEIQLLGESNLWPNMLTENLELLGLQSMFVKNEKTRLSLLVSRRNGIAHGAKDEVEDLEEFIGFEEVVTRVMIELGIAMIEALNGKSYEISPMDTSIFGRLERVKKNNYSLG